MHRKKKKKSPVSIEVSLKIQDYIKLFVLNMSLFTYEKEKSWMDGF